MAQTIDLTDRLTNEKSTIKIDKDHTYKVNESKNAVIQIMQYQKKVNSKDYESISDMADKIIETALGKEALKYINSLDPTFDQINIILDAITAVFSKQSLDEIEEKAKEVEKDKLDSFRKQSGI